MGSLMNLPDRLTTSSLTVTPATAAAYADLTNDHNPIHLDPAFAATTPFGRPIAHGTCSLNALWQSLLATFPPEVVARADLDLQFVAPVFVGDTIAAGGTRSEEGARYEVWIKSGERLVVRGTLTLE